MSACVPPRTRNSTPGDGMEQRQLQGLFAAGGAQTAAPLEESVPQLNDVLAPIAADVQAVDAVIRERLASDVSLINTIADYIIGAGGKRLRPAVLLLLARALGYRGTAHDFRHPVV